MHIHLLRKCENSLLRKIRRKPLNEFIQFILRRAEIGRRCISYKLAPWQGLSTLADSVHETMGYAVTLNDGELSALS